MVGRVTHLPSQHAAPGSGSLVFEWNGTDTSQFDTSTVYSDGGSLGSPSLAVVADADVPGGNVLRMSCSGTGEGYAIILATDALPSKNFEIQCEVRTTGTNGQGFCFYGADSSGLYCYGTTGLGTSRYFRVDAGAATAFASSGTTQIIASGDGMCNLRVRGDHPASAGPRGAMEWTGQYAGFASCRAYMKNIRDDFPSEPAPSGWHGLEADRWGLVLYAAGGGATGPLDIASLRIYDLDD